MKVLESVCSHEEEGHDLVEGNKNNYMFLFSYTILKSGLSIPVFD